MTKKFTFKQLFSIADGRMSTTIDDIYDILNHVMDETGLMTHQLPTASDYLKLKNPQWLTDYTVELNALKQAFGDDFKVLMAAIDRSYNIEIDVPQLKDEFDMSDLGDFIANNSILLKMLK